MVCGYFKLKSFILPVWSGAICEALDLMIGYL